MFLKIEDDYLENFEEKSMNMIHVESLSKSLDYSPSPKNHSVIVLNCF